MITAVDSNILIDILTGTVPVRNAAEGLLVSILDEDDDLICCDVVYAEVSQSIKTKQAMDEFLAGLHIDFVRLDAESAFLAGRAFARYRKAAGKRTRILPDFLIGGHALVQADRLLTRDRGFLKNYFNELKVIGVE